MAGSVTSVTVGGLELLDPFHFTVGQDTYFVLRARPEHTARLVQMADRHPAYVGKTPQSRSIPLLIYLLANTADVRIADYNTLLAALDTSGLVPVTWTEDGVTRRYWCHVDSAVPSEWMSRAVINLVAPYPYPEVV